ncbi:MAG: TetR-like C-terminal domain-containing protein [Oscillospiraceae bacterium]
MSDRPLNRNAIRSKNAIKNAFVELMRKNDISKVKVKDILILADVSRATFYAHYQDVYSVLEEIENTHIELLKKFLNAQPRYALIDDFMPFIKQLFEQIQENEEFFKMLFAAPNANTFLSKLQKVFVDYMMEDEALLQKVRSAEQARLFFSFIAIGTANLLQEWFINEHTFSFDELANMLNEAILNGISSIKK